MKIEVDELIVCLERDPVYCAGEGLPYSALIDGMECGVPATASPMPEEKYVFTRGVIDEICSSGAQNHDCMRFRSIWKTLFCKNDAVRLMIFLWCMMGLRIYQKMNERGDFKQENFDWKIVKDDPGRIFFIETDELGGFLTQHAWPRPAFYFPDALDNTMRMKTLDEVEYDEGWFKAAKAELSRLESELFEINNFQATGEQEWGWKKREIKYLEQQFVFLKGRLYPTAGTPQQFSEAVNEMPESLEHKEWVADADLEAFVELNINKKSVVAKRRALLAIMILRLNEKAARFPEYEFCRKSLGTKISEIHKTLEWVAANDGRCNAGVEESVKIESSSFKDSWRKEVKSGLAVIGKGNAGVRSRRISEEIKNPASGEILYIDQ